jgi:phage gp36-like protein
MYCTINDLKKKMSEASIAKLSNDTDSTQIDEDVVEEIISDISKEIDGYVRSRYPLDEVSDNTILKNICVQLTKLALHERRSTLSEAYQEVYNRQYKKLESIQRGTITLDIDDSDDRPQFFETESPTQQFTDELYEEYNG